jgi:hypothetical protein
MYESKRAGTGEPVLFEESLPCPDEVHPDDLAASSESAS